MSIQFVQPDEGLTRSGSYFLPGSSWSWLFWVITPVISGTNYGVVYVFGDPAYVGSYIAIRVDINGINVRTFDGTTTTNIGNNAFDKAVWKSFGVTYNSATTTISLLVNGVSVDTMVVNLSTFVFTTTTERLFTDASNSVDLIGALEIFNARTWQALLTATQLTAEAFSVNAVITSGLLSDTPLVNDTDLVDDSGNGRNWTTIGSGGSRTSPTLVPTATANIDATSAYELGTFPKTIIQNCRPSGTTLTKWFKGTSPLSAVVIGSWGFGDLVTFRPTGSPYLGPAAAPVIINSIAGQNIPIQFPILPETEFFIRELRNTTTADPAFLILDVLVAPNDDVVSGDIAINDDTEDFPLAILDVSEDYTVKKFISPFLAGEAGDILPNGNMLVDNGFSAEVLFYNRLFAEIGSITPAVSNTEIRSNRVLNNFVVGIKTNPVTIKTVDSLGNISAVVATLTGSTSIQGLCLSNNGSLLYFNRHVVNDALRVWDMLTDTADPDFAAGVVNYVITDVLVLTDDSLLVSFFKGGSPRDLYVKHYSSVGVVLNTYNFGASIGGTMPRMAYALDHPNSFWIWFHLIGADAGKNKLQNVKVSDGSILITRLYAEYEGGAYQGAETSTPFARFGASFSCPFWILTGAAQVAFRSGLYELVPGKLNDTLYDEDGLTEDVEIPEPSATSYLLGDE